MRTRLTDVLQIEHPVMLAGMGGVSYHQLVAAVTEAGGFGCMGASAMGHGQMIEEIAKVRELTDKPFGVDLLTAAPQDMEAKVEDIIDGGATVFVAGLGVPRDVIELCHQRNVLVVNMCGKVRHAIAAVEAGCDIVVAQGTEAGGHTGQVATMALVPQVVDAVGDRVPVVAAGGIFDGRGLAAALALGADGIWVGTRFIATPEAQLGARATRRRSCAPTRTAPSSPAPTRARPAGSCATTTRGRSRHAGGVPSRSPMQFVKSMQDGANHLGGDESTPGRRPGQGVHAGGPGRRRHQRAGAGRRARRALRRRGRGRPRRACDRSFG